ncbi:hypothetical protein WJX74_009674 [Apatococcus lobatus]|uniref:mannan endo-1,4-beta-mannosidase n=1 Tax=Apatococcus lobatus TaxID=904363 RepID=A0AAW1R1F4_9CHLO
MRKPAATDQQVLVQLPGHSFQHSCFQLLHAMLIFMSSAFSNDSQIKRLRSSELRILQSKDSIRCQIGVDSQITSRTALDATSLAHAATVAQPSRKLLQTISTSLVKSPPTAFSSSLFSPAATLPSAPPLATGFIKTFNGKFVSDDCTEHIFTGWDSWRLVEAANGIANALPKDSSLLDGKNFVDWLFDYAVAHKLKVVRMFGFGDVQDGQGAALESASGVFDEQVFKGIDKVLDSAAKHDLKVIIALADNWKPTDGLSAYAKRCSNGDVDLFWSSTACLSLYQAHVNKVLNRVNSINGLIYKNDPAIFSWNIFNEPRCSQDISEDDSCKPGVQGFVDQMAAYIKGIDKNHMVTVGEEGFFAAGDPAINGNPQGTWSGKTGQDFRGNHMSKNIDFATIHMWPDNWKDLDSNFISNWLTSHMNVAKQLGKPLILEEFGREVDADSDAARDTERNPTHVEVYKTVQDSITTGGSLRAAMFWEWFVRPEGESIPGGITSRPYGISQFDNTYTGPIQDHANWISQHPGDKVPGCVPGTQGGAPSKSSG